MLGWVSHSSGTHHTELVSWALPSVSHSLCSLGCWGFFLNIPKIRELDCEKLAGLVSAQAIPPERKLPPPCLLFSQITVQACQARRGGAVACFHPRRNVEIIPETGQIKRYTFSAVLQVI